MAEEKKNKEMEVFAASLGTEVEIQGKKIMIRPYSWADTFRMAQPLMVILNTLFTSYKALGKTLERADKVLEKTLKHPDSDNVVIQLKVLTEFLAVVDNTEDVIEALTKLLATGAHEDEMFVRGLDPADAFILGKAIFEANKDFFTVKADALLPKSKKKVGK